MKMEGPAKNENEGKATLEGNSWTLPTSIDAIDLAEDAFEKNSKKQVGLLTKPLIFSLAFARHWSMLSLTEI